MIITDVSVHVNTVDTKEMLYARALHAGICKKKSWFVFHKAGSCKRTNERLCSSLVTYPFQK